MEIKIWYFTRNTFFIPGIIRSFFHICGENKKEMVFLKVATSMMKAAEKKCKTI